MIRTDRFSRVVLTFAFAAEAWTESREFRVKNTRKKQGAECDRYEHSSGRLQESEAKSGSVKVRKCESAKEERGSRWRASAPTRLLARSSPKLRTAATSPAIGEFVTAWSCCQIRLRFHESDSRSGRSASLHRKRFHPHVMSVMSCQYWLPIASSDL